MSINYLDDRRININIMKKIYFLILFIFISGTILSQVLHFSHGGITREYYINVPNTVEEDAVLVFVLHGYSSSATNIKDYSGFDQLSDANGFVVCYPQGTFDNSNNRFWNVGYEFHQNETVDDAGFLCSLAQYLQDEYNLNEANTFCTGMSNGGDMSYFLACEAPDVFRAVAPVAGCMMEWFYNSCSPANPIPVFEIHGTNDEVTYWEGDIYNYGGWGAYLSIPNTFDFWVQKNDCVQFTVESLPDNAPFDGSTIESTKYSNGINHNEVWLYKVEGGGHDWPGSWGNMDIDASVEIWKFFQMVMENNVYGVNDMHENHSFKLHQNYPNPFLSETTVSYELMEKQHVTVSIYDSFGKEIVQLVNEIQGPGVKSVNWMISDSHANSLVSGLYCCRIVVGKSIQSMMMILHR
jgi:polyhydroxybutyrate depolymerase